MPEIVKTVPHLAFAVDNLDAALEGKQILIEPNSPSRGVRVAFILDDGAPIELLEFDKPAGVRISRPCRTDQLASWSNLSTFASRSRAIARASAFP